ncbi:antibiotic biosynthesis monooxygenase [Marinomonas sp. 42_23_T18]|nr:antibiotic biosynthesis monooxygenase [Marinomonas sp. 42_23_T18]
MSVTVVVSFKVKPSLVNEFIDVLQSHQSSMIQAGAKNVSLFTTPDRANKIFEIETWDSVEDHKEYVRMISESSELEKFNGYLVEPYKVSYLKEVSRLDAF